MKKRIYSLFTSFIMAISLVTVMPAVAADTLTSGDYEYIVHDDGTVEITKYIGSESELIMPSNIDGKVVTKIYDYALVNCDFKSITVDTDNKYFSSEDGVLFNKNKTEIIRYPSCSERELYVIPNGVTNIYSNAFDNCDNLIDIIIPNSVITIGESAFSECYKLRSIVIPDGVTKIAAGTFSSCCELYSVILGNSVESIDFKAFYYCINLLNITMPKSLKNIHWSSFDDRSIFTIRCYSDSYAHQYAIDYDFKYELLDPQLEGTVYYQKKTDNAAVRFLAEVNIEDVTNTKSGNIKVTLNGEEVNVKVKNAYSSIVANGKKVEPKTGKCFIITPAIEINDDGGDIVSVEFTLDSCLGSLSRKI